MNNGRFGEWLAGFSEGDGSPCCRYKLDNRGYYSLNPSVEYTQKYSEVLEYVRRGLGFGHLGKSNKYWHLKFFGQKRFLVFLDVCAPYLVSWNFLARTNGILLLMDRGLILSAYPTLDWTAGFWDAEGSSSTFEGRQRSGLLTPHISIANKDGTVLEQVVDVLGCGGVYPGGESGHQWCIDGLRDCRDFAKLLVERSHHPQKRAKLIDDMQKVEDSRRGRKYLKIDVPQYENKAVYNAAYYGRNREKMIEHQHERNREITKTRRETRRYIREHPEVVERLSEVGKK